MPDAGPLRWLVVQTKEAGFGGARLSTRRSMHETQRKRISHLWITTKVVHRCVVENRIDSAPARCRVPSGPDRLGAAKARGGRGCRAGAVSGGDVEREQVLADGYMARGGAERLRRAAQRDAVTGGALVVRDANELPAVERLGVRPTNAVGPTEVKDVKMSFTPLGDSAVILASAAERVASSDIGILGCIVMTTSSIGCETVAADVPK
jgi:hypothetical protein